MNISDVAKQTGLTAKTLRFYEEKGLVIPMRQDNGYRFYTDSHVAELTLLRQARQVGFTLEECAELLALFRNPARHSADVKAKTEQKIAQLEQQIADLQQMHATLHALVDACPGNEEADCPIISGLSGMCHTPTTDTAASEAVTICTHCTTHPTT